MCVQIANMPGLKIASFGWGRGLLFFTPKKVHTNNASAVDFIPLFLALVNKHAAVYITQFTVP